MYKSIFVCMHVCAWYPQKSEENTRFPGTRVNSQLWVITGAPVTKSASSAFNCWAAPLVPFCFLIFTLMSPALILLSLITNTPAFLGVTWPDYPLLCPEALLSLQWSLALRYLWASRVITNVPFIAGYSATYSQHLEQSESPRWPFPWQ